MSQHDLDLVGSYRLHADACFSFPRIVPRCYLFAIAGEMILVFFVLCLARHSYAHLPIVSDVAARFEFGVFQRDCRRTRAFLFREFYYRPYWIAGGWLDF